MKQLIVGLQERAYSIYIESGILSQAGTYCKKTLTKAKKMAVVSDSNVAPLYAKVLLESLESQGFQCELFVVPAGESSKSLDQLGNLYDGFMEFGLTRTDAVVALGGGVVGDLAGFAAATILRGVDFVQIPTTLLAQVDSSVGGKVAIDLPAGKNLAGAFWQPKLVLMDPNTLETLDDSTFADGMAEVIKYGCIFDATFFDLLEKLGNRAGIMSEIERVLHRCCELKKSVVEQDERDTGERMKLNFGHTLGHAYELAGNFETYTHGQAVAAGMSKVANLGVALGVTSRAVPTQVDSILEQFGLPTSIPCSQGEYAHAVGLDKKGSGSEITLILVDKIGSCCLHNIEKSAVLELI